MKNFHFPFIRLCSMVIMGISVQSLCGHLLGRPAMYDWNRSGIGMGMNTAVCFIVTAIALFYIALVKEEKRHDAKL